MRCTELTAGLGILALAVGCARPAPPPEPAALAVVRQPLALGVTVERHDLASGSRDYFEVALRAGELLDLVAEQHGADVKLGLRDPEGNEIAVYDRPVGRNKPEPLLFHAERGGVYGLDLELPKVDPGGWYSLSVESLGPARPGEVVAARGALALARAHELRRAGRPKDAAERYREALADFRLSGDRTAVEDTLGWLATVAADAEEWAEVVVVLGELQPRLQAGHWLRLARAQAGLGRPEEAFASNLQGLKQARDGKKVREEALALYQIAALLRAASQLPAAEWAYERSASLYHRAQEPKSEASAHLALTSLYAEVEAEELATRTLKRAEAAALAGVEVDRDFLALQKAEVARLAGRPDETRRLAEGLLAEGTAKTNIIEGARDLLLRLARDRGDWAEAERWARERLAGLAGPGETVALALQDLGQILAYRGDTAAARDTLERALAASSGAEPGVRAAILAGLARVAQAEGQPLAAWNRATEALELVEGFRERAGRPELRLSWTAGTQDYFDLAVGILVDLERQEPGGGHLARVLETSERGRARGLLDALEPPGSGLGRRVRLEDQRSELERRREELIVSGAAPAELAETEEQQRRLVAELEALPAPAIDRLEPPRVAEKARASQVVGSGTLAAVRQLTGAGFQVLEYDLGEVRSHLFWLSAEGMSVFDLPPRAELEALSREAHRVLAQSSTLAAGQRPARVLDELGEILLDPVSERLGRGPVVIIPDGALWLVPFAALTEPSTGRAFVEGREVLAAPSLAILDMLRERGGRLAVRPRVAVFADPVYQASDPRVEPRSRDLAWPEEEGRWRANGGQLDRLTFSGQEADLLRELVPAERLAVATGLAATKARLESLTPGSVDLLHLATHGLFHPTEPSLSGLVLSLVDERGLPRDGVLRAHEIARLRLPARLVVASACATAQGREIRGEGVVSLAHAFFRAGASRVLVTLWPVDDEATAVLMRHFYRSLLLEGASPAAALRQAQLALRADPRFRSPFYWAGFVLQGEP